MNTEHVIEQTRQWIDQVVIGLNLCPFAHRVFSGELIRYRVTEAAEEVELVECLIEELRGLVASPAIETTILIHPNVLGDFLDYNDFLEVADRCVGSLKLHGTIQIASFHPGYQFAGTAPDDVENYTNRSPFPMLHLLREESVTNVADDPEALDDIPARNIARLRKLGRERILQMLAAIKNAPPPG